MSTQKDGIYVMEVPLDADNEGQTPNNTEGGESKRHKKRGSNKYKRFNKETREKVLFWGNMAMFLVAASICVASFTVPSLRNARPRGIAMWQWSLLITVLLGGPLLSEIIGLFIRLILDRDLIVKENVAYYVLELVESAWVVLWFSMVLVAWLIVVEEPSYLGVPYDESEKIIKKFTTTYPIINVTLISIIMGSVFWLLKELVIAWKKSSFHIRRFFYRIKDALMYQFVINGLQGVMNSKKSGDSGKDKKSTLKRLLSWKRKKKKNVIIDDVSCLDEVTPESVSCWGMKQVIDWMMENQYLTYHDKGDDGKITEKEIQNDDDATKAANLIFSSLFPDQHQHDDDCHIGDKELKMHFPKEEDRKRVKDCLHEGAVAQQINKKVFTKWMVKAYRTRLSLSNALVANKRLFRALNRFINVLIVLLIFALWLIMIRAETRRVIFVIATAIAGSAFVFGDTCKSILENLLFLYLVHPFDIGDSCLIDDTPVIIEDINVLSTKAVTFDNEIRHYANTKLAGQTISNYTRSNHMGDVIEFTLDANTVTQKFEEELKDKVKSYIDKSKQYWSPEHHLVMEFAEKGTVKMKLHIQHTINYHDFHERQIRKSMLVSEINKILIDMI